MSLPKPAGYVAPPPPRAADVLRTVRVLATDLIPLLVKLAFQANPPSTNDVAGLAYARTLFLRALGHAGLTLEVLHRERVQPQGGLILMWNQTSHLEHLILGAAIPRPFLSLYNNEFGRFPIYGSYMKRTGHLLVDRKNETQWRASVALAAARAQAGACILVSPEGTRSWDGELLPLKRGAFLLATTSAQPIVCVTIIGGHQRLARGSAFVRKGPLRVVFSEPIATAGETTEALMQRVRETFQSVKSRYRL